MSVELMVCEGCGRHVREVEAQCPFCAAAVGRSARATAPRATVAACLAVAAGLSLQACYGGPPRPRSYAFTSAPTQAGELGAVTIQRWGAKGAPGGRPKGLQ